MAASSTTELARETSARSSNGRVHVVGVRHHSPACARLVEATIRELRPATVLIEGPSDFNDRLGELLLGHSLPIALFSFLRLPDGMSRASWYPICEYSPEWTALHVGTELGCDVKFMDLPSWHDAFADVENLGSDRVDRYGAAIDHLCEATGTNGHDALWDHLFEGCGDLAELAPALDRYFEEIRVLSELSPRDAAREEHMRAYVRSAVARGGDVVVVCGGFHAPALLNNTEMEANTEAAADADNATVVWPNPPSPNDGTAETYLVPYTYSRLDSFTGYQSGMPSPGYYDVLHRAGVEAATDAMMERTATALRRAGIKVSTADLVAVQTQTEALARLRGHAHPLRVDLLDGLASGLLKEAHDQPLPWDQRAPLDPRTHPLLAAIVATFTGDREGRLDPATPNPPLLADARLELERVGLTPTSEPRPVELDLTIPAKAAASAVLHRLRSLGIPGFERNGTGIGVRERWTVKRVVDADVALIEASVYGPTLESAVAGRLRNAIGAAVAASSSSAVGAVLLETVHCRLRMLDHDVVNAANLAIRQDQQIATVGAMLDTLSVVMSADEVLDATGISAAFRAQVGALVPTCIERFVWLLEQIVGPSSPTDDDVVKALVAMVQATRRGGLDTDIIGGVLTRKATGAETPPAIRGAALGALWTLGLLDGDGMDDAIGALRGLGTDEQPGDYLSGLFATARRLVTTDDRLLAAIDALVDDWTADDFLVLLPGLRRAFSWFPPRERSEIAGRVGALRGLSPRVRLTGLLPADPAQRAAGMALDEATTVVLTRYGLAWGQAARADS